MDSVGEAYAALDYLKGTSILKKRLTKKATVGASSGKQQANGSADKDWNGPLMLDRDELMVMLQECLTDFATEVGLKVACLLFEKRTDMSGEGTTSGHAETERRRPVRRKKKMANTT
jgi:hypothetical protein